MLPETALDDGCDSMSIMFLVVVYTYLLHSGA